MEIGGALSFIFIVLALEPDKTDIGQYFSFKFPYYQDNLCIMIIMGTIYGIVRVIGAVGLMKNKMWGFTFSIINCIVTMLLMSFMLPMGIVDGIFACSALILMLLQYHGKKKQCKEKKSRQYKWIRNSRLGNLHFAFDNQNENRYRCACFHKRCVT